MPTRFGSRSTFSCSHPGWFRAVSIAGVVLIKRGVLSQQRQIDGGGHCRVCGVGSVEMVAWMIAVADLSRIGRIADGFVEVEHAIDLPGATNPRVDRLSNGLTLLRIVEGTPIWRNGRGQHFESMGTRPGYELAVRPDQGVSRRFARRHPILECLGH